MVKIHTSKGVITIELFADAAPKTVENFLQYARDGFYEGTLFHRVIKGFMIQGGGLTSDMKQKKTRAPVINEACKELSNARGTLAMARTSDPHSATAQFFVNVKNNTFLDFKSPTPDGWGYCVFGRVIDGMDIVEAIENVSTTTRAGHQDVPSDDVLIEKVEVVNAA